MVNFIFSFALIFYIFLLFVCFAAAQQRMKRKWGSVMDFCVCDWSLLRTLLCVCIVHVSVQCYAFARVSTGVSVCVVRVCGDSV